MKKKLINPYMQDYAMGGALSGGLSGGMTGAKIGTMLLPGIGTGIGAGVGALIGGISGSKKENAANSQEMQMQQKLAQSNYDGQLNQNRLGSYNDSVNNPINPIAQGYAYGGTMGGEGTGMINSTDVNTFNEGGTHEQNPLGGIPQGIGANGQPNTVEENEVKVKLGKDNSYIFSDRLIFQ